MRKKFPVKVSPVRGFTVRPPFRKRTAGGHLCSIKTRPRGQSACGGGYASKAFYVSSRKIYESAINIVREEGCLPLRYSICAYLRSSRQGAFCGHSAMPNAALFTPVAPLHENLFCKNIFVIAAVHFSKSEPPRAILLPPIAAERKHAVSRRRVRGLSL